MSTADQGTQSATDYIVHHLTNLQVGHGFWTFNLDTLIVSGLLGFLVFGLMWMVARAVDPPLNEVVAALALHHDNYRPFMQGTLKLGSVAYYVAVSFFFLLSAIKVLEARRWH